MKLPFILFATLFTGLTLNSFSQTTVPGGDVSGTWDVSGSPFLIQEDITIPDDSTLTIHPGVEVEFQGHFSLTVLGRLLAIGTEIDSIHFTINDTTGFGDVSTNAGGWYGIRFTDTPLHNDSSKIVYCCLEYGKAYGDVWHLNAGGAICILQFGKVLIANCLIQNNLAVSTSEHPSIGGGLYFFRSDIVLRDNTFINNRAQAGGAIFFDDSDPDFENNKIDRNYAGSGGGIEMGGECHPTFNGDEISDNVAENNGGGILFYEPSVVQCDQVVFSGNKAVWGGGIGNQGGELQAQDCLFSENLATLWGGGVAGDFASLNLNNCTFERNVSEWGSGGLHMDHAIGYIENCDFEENEAVFGGGFHALFSQISSVHNTFLNNQTEGGGGIHLEDSDCFIDGCQFHGNQALNGTGGAIDYIADSTIFGRDYMLTIYRSSITENNAYLHSGAVRIEQTQSDSSLIDVLIDSCQFIKNQSDVYGSLRIGSHIEGFEVANSIFKSNTSKRYVSGAGFISESKGRVYNCIFNSNYSGYSDTTRIAHGASLGSGAEVEFVNCSFVDSSSAAGVGLTVRRGSKADIINTIFWGCGDHPINIVTQAELGCTVSVNYCTVENGLDSIHVSDALSVLNWGIGNMAKDPLFIDLDGADLHLQDSSPCIGAGVNNFTLNEKDITAPSSDIEGNPRPNPQGSQTDIGAYEHNLGAPISTGNDITKISEEDILIHNYPNPFCESTIFRYHLSMACTVNLIIYNIYGQQVETLVSNYQTAGTYMVKWDGSAFESGPYFYFMETDMGVRQSGRLLLIK